MFGAVGSMSPLALQELVSEELDERFGRRYAAGQVVFHAGSPAEDGAYLLQEGRVRLIHRVGSQERGLRVVRPGELFGETGLLPAAERTSTAVAMLETRALVLSAGAFEELLASKPSLGLQLLQQVSRRLRDTEQQIHTLMLRDSQLKVTVTLIQLAQSLGAGTTPDVQIAISPLELSARVGLDVDTVKRIVQQLQGAGYLSIQDERVRLPDLEALRELRGLLEVKDTLAGQDPGAPKGSAELRPSSHRAPP
jgi:CRP/FNR family transcriptional regulator, cyclic AMP receptor protein